MPKYRIKAKVTVTNGARYIVISRATVKNFIECFNLKTITSKGKTNYEAIQSFDTNGYMLAILFIASRCKPESNRTCLK